MRLIVTSALLSALALVHPAAAQEQRGAIEGTVQDAQRAVVPGATVAALNLGQGATVSTITDATGAFRFPALPPGYYDVTASLPGSAAMKFARVEVLLGQILVPSGRVLPATHQGAGDGPVQFLDGQG